jgi:hypothetical protein
MLGDDDTKPVWPTWAVGALVRVVSCAIFVGQISVSETL